ncbi:MAG: beta-ketoacyl-[acyl-carrier-protein] synthase family protein [Gemmataceae bacterium]
MPTTSRRAVLTGLGVLTPVGTDPDSFFNRLLDGVSGVAPITMFDASPLACRIAGQMADFDAKKFLPASAKDARKSLKVMARTVQMGVCASQKAMDDAGLQKGSVAPHRFGIEFGCVMVASDVDDFALAGSQSINRETMQVDFAAWGGEKGIGNITPLWMLKYLPNMPACHTSIFFDAQGPNNTITTSEVAGLLALGEAYRLMARNRADFFLVGGTESKVNSVSYPRHDLFSILTKRNDDPAGAVRPFDKTRDGTVQCEAACTFGLEEYEHARKRNARIYAELVGFASGFDRGMKGTTFAHVIRHAMKEAGIGCDDVDHVNAAAGGWPEYDAWEARAIAEVFGTAVPVFAPKGHFGNAGAAGGLVELAASALALHRGQLPGTKNYSTADPRCPVAVHSGSPRPVTKPYVLKTGFTDRGQCTAVVIRKFDPNP